MEKTVENSCETCSMRSACRYSTSSWLFFLVGLVATIAMRVIEPLRLVDPLYAKISWYVGVSGFFLFFVYKYLGLRESSRVIGKSGLAEKLSSRGELSRGDYLLVREVLCSHDNWQERVNFFVIFALSAVALLVALFYDLGG